MLSTGCSLKPDLSACEKGELRVVPTARTVGSKKPRSRVFGEWARYAVVFSWLTMLGCTHGTQPQRGSQRRGEALVYSFGTVDGELVGSDQHRGRVTVLLFVTTFDVLSQASVKRLEDLYRSHAPRINALAVVLEAPQYAELARSFRDVLELSYPVALVEKESLSSYGMLAAVQTVPAWIFLDASGYISFAGSGALSMEQLEQAVGAAQR